MMPKKLWIGAALGAITVAVGAYLVSPLLAANALRSAAIAGDAGKLQRLVEFPAVRESLKGQLNAMLIQAMQSDPEFRDNPFAGLAVVMAPAIVNQAIEGYVTAEGIGAMMQAQRPRVLPPRPGQALGNHRRRTPATRLRPRPRSNTTIETSTPM